MSILCDNNKPGLVREQQVQQQEASFHTSNHYSWIKLRQPQVCHLQTSHNSQLKMSLSQMVPVTTVLQSKVCVCVWIR